MGVSTKIVVIAAALLAGVAACSGSDAVAPTVTVSALTIVSGNGQTGTVNAVLPDTLKVKVTDQNGNVVVGETINWTVATGSGTVTPSSAAADANGIAATVWTLGPTAGAQTVTATSASNPSVTAATFTATADTTTTTTTGS